MARTYRSSETTAARSLVAQCEHSQGYLLLGGGHFNLRNARDVDGANSTNAGCFQEMMISSFVAMETKMWMVPLDEPLLENAPHCAARLLTH
mmetsp:Transcript_8888/g.32800  ORF Transcript_8888/g.32800 Transcript_8888/m.32800 type:complete len:92 (+) Transcript_8888:143-418(+)